MLIKPARSCIIQTFSLMKLFKQGFSCERLLFEMKSRRAQSQYRVKPPDVVQSFFNPHGFPNASGNQTTSKTARSMWSTNKWSLHYEFHRAGLFLPMFTRRTATEATHFAEQRTVLERHRNPTESLLVRRHSKVRLTHDARALFSKRCPRRAHKRRPTTERLFRARFTSLLP